MRRSWVTLVGMSGHRGAVDAVVSGHADAAHLVLARPSGRNAVLPHALVDVRFRVRNVGSVDWTGRRLQRIGAPGGVRLIRGPRSVVVADTPPGSEADVRFTVRAPAVAGTVVAYWRMVDADGTPCLPELGVLSVRLLVG